MYAQMNIEDNTICQTPRTQNFMNKSCLFSHHTHRLTLFHPFSCRQRSSLLEYLRDNDLSSLRFLKDCYNILAHSMSNYDVSTNFSTPPLMGSTFENTNIEELWYIQVEVLYNLHSVTHYFIYTGFFTMQFWILTRKLFAT